MLSVGSAIPREVGCIRKIAECGTGSNPVNSASPRSPLQSLRPGSQLEPLLWLLSVMTAMCDYNKHFPIAIAFG